MEQEEYISFAVCCRTSVFQSERFALLEYDTVEHLKIEIHKAFAIPTHKQIINGWKSVPEDDQTILQFCSHPNRINYLTVSQMDIETLGDNCPADKGTEDSTELQAVKSCIKKICAHVATSHVKFNIATLTHARENWLLVPPENRKVVLLYLHNSQDAFSNIFLRKLNDPTISDILIKSFYVLGWDVENVNYHPALCKALLGADLEHLSSLIETKTCAAILIQNINGNIKVLSLLIDDSEEDTFFLCLKNCQDFLTVDFKCASRSDSSPHSDDINSARFQKIMADMLGDRDYDMFACDQHDLLKRKIGYALFGQPAKESGNYEDKNNERIEKMFDVILKHNNKFCEYKDQVEISFVYNVMEPVAKEKRDRKKKNPNYIPDTDINPVPIFVLRKCRNSEGEACRVFIDDGGRVYNNWKSYINDNKLPKCVMVLPKNGRYTVVGEELMLETHDSPECSPLKLVVTGGDIASAVGGVGSGGVLMAAGIASIPVAPFAVIGAGVVGAVAGVYSLARSAVNLADRVKHDEDCTLKNSEARGIYFNILAGSLGFVGAGANMAVSQIAARGFNISQGVGAVVNTIGVANIGVSGASLINSGYDVFDQWYNQNQTPSLLTIVQLSSSVLFFGNAVYYYKFCQTIVDESQAKVLQDYQDSLRSNRHRKTFNKMMKETIRQNDGNQVRGKTEVIKTIRNIPNKDEVFAVLTRTKKLMNEKGVKFFASDGDITLNGQTINMNEFVTMNKQQASAFLSNLPTETHISTSDTNLMINDFSLNRLSLPNVECFARYALRLISTFGTDVQGMLLQIVEDVCRAAFVFLKEVLQEIFPNNTTYQNMLDVVMEYFGDKAAEFLKKYNMWRRTGSPYYYDSEYVEVPENDADKYVWIFEKAVKLCFSGGRLSQGDYIDIVKYLKTWLEIKVYEYQVNKDADETRINHSPVQSPSVTCSICNGQYFKNE